VTSFLAAKHSATQIWKDAVRESKHVREDETELELQHDSAPGLKGQRRLIAALSLLTAVNGGVLILRHLPASALAPISGAPGPLSDIDAGTPPAATPPPSQLAQEGAQASGENQERVDSLEALPSPGDPDKPEEAQLGFQTRTIGGQLKGRETLAAALDKAGLSPEQSFEIVHALKGIFNFRYARPRDSWSVKLGPDQSVLFFEYQRSLLESYCVVREEGSLRGYRREIKLEKEVVLVSGLLNSSLYESMSAIGEKPELAMMLAEVLAWDIDFYRDPRPGDSFKIIVEKERYKTRTIGYSRILAAEYRGGVGTYRIFRYPSPTGGDTFYDEEGKSAQKALLKAPIKFVHITSSFGNRRHPILGYNRMHQGVDYGSPTGTPVWAVGDGSVIWAARKGANGNLIGLRHSNGYTTWYAHLSRIKVKSGQRVHQKDVIGLVGSTGRSTGPHLHYGIKKDGRFINPLAIKLPPRRPLPQKQLPKFKQHIAPLLQWLDTPGAVAALQLAGPDSAPPPSLGQDAHAEGP